MLPNVLFSSSEVAEGLHAGLEELLAHITLQIGPLNGWQ